MPITGWSRESGDLRVPHFVGMHAIQGLLLLAWVLRRLGVSMEGSGPTRGVGVTGGLLAVVWAMTLFQALAGQSLVDPGPWRTGLWVALGGLGTTVVWLLTASRGKVVAA